MFNALFLSTHSKRSATGVPNNTTSVSLDFYPRTPSGVRRRVQAQNEAFHVFLSTHSKRSATKKRTVRKKPLTFLSTHSKRSATGRKKTQKRQICISIHALQAECDPQGLRTCPVCHGISIHALQAECDAALLDKEPPIIISIHALQAECDNCVVILQLALLISIHALQAECDNWLFSKYDFTMDFYPRTPSGVRQADELDLLELEQISIHALQAECDMEQSRKGYGKGVISIHALQAECDSNHLAYSVPISKFLSTHSKRSATVDTPSHINGF